MRDGHLRLRAASLSRAHVPRVGAGQSWAEVTDILGDLVSFQSIFVFEADGTVLTSETTLHFRQRDEVADSLMAAVSSWMICVTHPTGPVVSWSSSQGVPAEPSSLQVIPRAARPLIRWTAVVLWVSSEIRAFWGSISRAIWGR